MLGAIVGRGFPWKGGSLFGEVGLVEGLEGLEGLALAGAELVFVSAGLAMELTGIMVATARVANAITETILNCIIVFFVVKTVILSTGDFSSEESG